MSFDLFVQRFENGNAATFSRADFDAVFGPYVTSREPDFVAVAFPDGSGSDVYVDDGETIDSIMFNRFDGDAFFEALHRLAARCKLAIYWPAPDNPIAVTDRSVEPHLPKDFVEDSGPLHIVGSGADIVAAIMAQPDFDPAMMEG